MQPNRLEKAERGCVETERRTDHATVLQSMIYSNGRLTSVVVSERLDGAYHQAMIALLHQKKSNS
jgi:hypothetical protein